MDMPFLLILVVAVLVVFLLTWAIDRRPLVALTAAGITGFLFTLGVAVVGVLA